MVVKFFVCISSMFLLIWKVGGYSTSYPNGYTTYTFTSSESFTPSFDIHANVLIVGGGGGGGNSLALALAGSGGGGAGGLGYGQRIFYAGQSYSISIGQGGSPGVNGGTTSINGNQVSENAYGGGYGGQDLGLICYTGSSGASGGGGCGNAVGGGSSGPGNGNLQYLGNSGGSGNQFGSGGGGGGAGGGGGVSGGSGFQWNINGQYYASGGGSGNGNNCGGANICCYNAQVNTGGSGLGNDGGTPFSGGHNGRPNSGCGGGGSGCTPPGNVLLGGYGGSGVVIIAFCNAGQADNGGSCTTCAAGYYSTYAGAPSCLQCGGGYYSPSAGSTHCSICSAGYAAPAGSSACSQCPAGTYALQGSSSCTPCPAGYYSVSAGSSTCSECPALHFSPYPGSTSCTACPSNSYYTPPGSSACHCNPIQAPGSLCSLLFQSDVTLVSYSASYTNQTDLFGVSQYLYSMLKIEVDINGDGIITRTEIVAALRYRSITSAAIDAIPVWISANYTDSVPVQILRDDAMMLFANSLQHSFDGSGVNVFETISSTYPNPTWNSNLCYTYDSFLNPSYSKITVSWQYTTSYSQAVSAGLTQVCGYVNGRLIGDYDTVYDLNRGYQTSLPDDGTNTDLKFKRVYCFVALYSNGPSQYQCSLGLFYV